MNLKDLSRRDIYELIVYDPISGKSWHCKRDVKWFRDTEGRSAEHESNRWNSRYAGKEITTSNNQEYVITSILSTPVRLHRVIWFYMTGEWPDYIDHINGDPSDNRWCNLRNVTKQENCKNQKIRNTNTSGVMGIHFRKDNRKWRAYIQNKHGKRVNLGSFKTKEEAIAARKAAEIEYGYHEKHGRC